ncbi:hypothetical protein [Desulfovibrio sp. ZJ369]|uniref:hypothetical protein n=1 Tax=Desulfovibrio sp. ZJ369 TaxID=2709793 RepID=UPI001F14A6EA|nr:hypothetical protein [Desulfovibrio sp. ZJ369]
MLYPSKRGAHGSKARLPQVPCQHGISKRKDSGKTTVSLQELWISIYSHHFIWPPGKCEKKLAVTLYSMGLSLTAIARIFHVSPPAVLRWVRNFAEPVYEKTEPAEAIIVELDEMWYFLKSKKQALALENLLS